MVIVLDSSALFSMEDLPDGDCVCPPGVIDELRKYKDRRLDLWGDMLRVSDCSAESMDKVQELESKLDFKKMVSDCVDSAKLISDAS